MNGLKLTLNLALRGLVTNWGRSVLTMLGIIIGVTAVITIMAVGEGAESLLTGAIASSGTKNITIQSGGNNTGMTQGVFIQTLTLADADSLEKIPYIIAVDPQSSATFDVIVKGKKINTTINGVGKNYPMIQNHRPMAGRFFTKTENRSSKRVALLGFNLVQELFGNQYPIGQRIRVGSVSFTVIGVLEKKGGSLFGSRDDAIFIPIETMQKQLLNENTLSSIIVHLEDESFINRTIETIKAKLRYQHDIDDPEDDDFTITSVAQTLQMVQTITSALSIFLVVIAGFSLIVGGIGVMNIMLMNVNQRTREIGLRKALGAKPYMIQQQFLIESLVLTTIGGIIGTILGILIAWGIALGAQYAEYDWVFRIKPASILLGVGLAIFTGYIFGSGPAKKAARLNAIEALRYE